MTTIFRWWSRPRRSKAPRFQPEPTQPSVFHPNPTSAQPTDPWLWTSDTILIRTVTV